MTLAITHNLVAVTPDNPAYEIRPSHWNDTHALTGTASVAQGGTGAATFTAGEILFGAGTSALDHSSNLKWNATTGLLSLKPISSPGPGSKDETYGALSKIWIGGGSNTVIGYNAHAGLSASADAAAYGNTIIGAESYTGEFSYLNTIIGNGSYSTNSNTVIIGPGSVSTVGNAVVIGYQSAASASIGVVGAIGQAVYQSHNGGMVIGVNTNSSRDYELKFGHALNAVNPVSLGLSGCTGSFVERAMLRWAGVWVDSTDATRKARSIFYVNDTAEREFMRSEALGASVQSQMTGAFYPPTDAGAIQAASAMRAGTGAPNNANGANGDYYFRSDGGAGTYIYFRAAGAWGAIL